jgi:signal peptidase II
MLKSPAAVADSDRLAVPASRYLIFALIAAAGCWLDLLTKRFVFAWRGMPGTQPIWWVWEGYIGIEPSLNTGALFGLGRDRVLWLAALSAVALLGLVAWFVYGRVGHDRRLTIVLACITAGILGNLYDRLGLWSLGPEGRPELFAVRDWIRFSYGRYVWPNFNVADSLLVCATTYLVWHSFRSPTAPPTGEQQTTATR